MNGPVASAMRVLADLLDGASNSEVARALIGLTLSLVPVSDLKQYLDDEARKRDDAIADAAEQAKVGG